MARFASKRVVVIAVVAVAAAAVAAGVAEANSGRDGGAASGGGSDQLATAAVVRTTLVNTVQVGGSISYAGTYSIAAPSGASGQEVAQQQLTVRQDEQTLSADERAVSDAASADGQAIAADSANVSSDRSALIADRIRKRRACAGAGASSATCSQDAAQVGQDQTALTQARQQLAAAQAAAKTDHDQDQAKVAADQTRLASDRASLTSLRATQTIGGTTYTWLPQPGQVIRQGQRVYAVSDESVPLLYGPVPAWRPFYAGMSDGADVGELTRGLIRLGYGAGLARSDHYSAATAAAVARWQKALGLPATGRILLGGVVFEPGPIRVSSVTPAPGAPYGGGGGAGGGGGSSGTVLTATGTTPVVTVDLGVTQEYLVRPRDDVTVVLPDGTTTVGGRVQSVGSVASCPGGGSAGTGNGSNGGGGSPSGQSPCSSAGSNGNAGSNSSATVTVTITLDHPPRGAAFDQAPVNVNITSQRAANVLAVPVNALLALAGGGGYAVQVVTGGTSHLVGVTTGLYSATLVQVSGPGLTAGMRVEVPSS